MEQAYKASKVVDKPLFIDVYTSWCGWCKRMDQTTFKDPAVVSYLNANFHPVKFDAETKDTIQFLERTYLNSQSTYVKRLISSSDSTIKHLSDSIRLLGGEEKYQFLINSLSKRLQEATVTKGKIARQGRRTSHDLAREVMNNQMSYPTFVLLFDSLKHNFPIKGYQKPEQLLSVLSFFGEKLYTRTNDLAGYQKLFFQALSGGATDSTRAFSEVIELAKLSKKKTLLLVTDDQSYRSMVMERACLRDPEVMSYLKDNFEWGKLSLYEKDTINFNKQSFKNVNGIHQLPLAFLQTQPRFPALVFLDEEQKLIMAIPEFFLPIDLVPILHFIEKEAYKTSDYPTFRKSYEKEKAAKNKAGQNKAVQN